MNEQGDKSPTTTTASNAEQYNEVYNHETNIHVCEGYDPHTPLPLDLIAIKRANAAGLCQTLSQFSSDSLDNFKLIEAQENSYEQQAQILDVIKELALPILNVYRSSDVEIGSFVSADTGLLNKVYLSQTHQGIIFCTMDEDRVMEVRKISSMEIWRYLYPPSRIVENIVSILIATAEKHKSIKDEWVLSFERIISLFNSNKKGVNKELAKLGPEDLNFCENEWP